MGETAKNMYYLSKEAMKGYYEQYFTERKEEWDLFVLINRKGYWDYKILFPDLQVNTDERRVVVSDRLLEKYPVSDLRKLLMGKRVIVYDDSLTNGSNLFYYFLMCKAYGAKAVSPVVYALNAEFPTERSRKLMKRESKRVDVEHLIDKSVEEVIEEFIDTLTCRLILGNKEIDRMSIWQTMLFQECSSPLVMDLPMLNHQKDTSKKNITLSKEQFEKLCGNVDEKWCFIDNEMNGWGKSVKASYFRFRSQLLNNKFSNLFHDFVVKCKYNQEGNSINVVFTPFAIVKSISYENVFFCFKLFYENTIYGQHILENFLAYENQIDVMKRDHNLCNAMFRAVIYRLSDYIGRNFQKYVKQLLSVTLEYDWNIMEDNFDPAFIKTQRELYDLFDEIELQNLIYQYHQGAAIPSLREQKCSNDIKVRGTSARIKNYVRKRTSEKKKDTDIPLEERIYTFETIESEVEQRFFFESEDERKEMLTNTCLVFLETNSFSNMIYADDNRHILYRGFRYGENSEIFLHETLWLFYSYLYAYYYEYGTRQIKENYNDFMRYVENYMQKQGYFDIWISKDDFCFLRDYFGEMTQKELVDEIQRREYLLDYIFEGKEDNIKKNLIKEAMEAVKLWEEV